MSPVRALPAEVAAVRALIAEGYTGIVRAADDREQFWIRSALERLAWADTALAGVVDGRPARLRALTTTAVTAAVAAGSAALARMIGGGLPVALALAGPLLALTLYRIGPARRRPATPAPPELPGPPGSGLAEVPAGLERARVRLVSAGLRRAGRANWRPPAMRRVIAADPVLARLAEADLLLCQAIDCLERYLDDLSKDWP
ncbi:hypothetical protein [Actinoplanes siamensis]|uniref:Uncharacterized protein n=1 Tax=Actinoplanes siamensis TaxID=1223317 RepID=A0A919TL63_9ACTN|nr:hypothetical protein [Actinoplanes siamensis]GIF05993.1 hypothetical protein Asi03nite_35310 [Actinoplanes siamensis]